MIFQNIFMIPQSNLNKKNFHKISTDEIKIDSTYIKEKGGIVNALTSASTEYLSIIFYPCHFSN